jgi:hypothetical protein
MCSFNIGLMRNLQKFVVSLQHEFHILVAEGDHSPVVEDQIVQKCVSLFVGVVDCLLVELQLGHAQAS